jgi:hypothetical protein
MGIRFLQQLQAIRKKFNPNAPDPVIFPVICTVSPHQVDQGKTQTIAFYGIRFNEYIKAGNSYRVDIQYADESTAKPNFRQVVISTDYLLQINLMGADWSGLDQSRDPRLVLMWGDKKVVGDQAAIPVVLMPPPHLRTLYSVPTAISISMPGVGGPQTLTTPVNEHASMPDGCALQGVQGIYWYKYPPFVFPPIESLPFGSKGPYGFALQRINPSDPRYLGVNATLTFESFRDLMVKIVYTVQENAGVNCSVADATSDAP